MSTMNYDAGSKPCRRPGALRDPTSPLSFNRDRSFTRNATRPVRSSRLSSTSDSKIWRQMSSMNWNGGFPNLWQCADAHPTGTLLAAMDILPLPAADDRSPEARPAGWEGDIHLARAVRWDTLPAKRPWPL